ncbi:hypothetical protein BDE36_1367 [Arcticibacter tournemirensis]|uniref:Molybdopterin-guanine dinucleotide biosynthesis protein MobB n=1 Tax=Arcticibacter tournemirensis TaxID=699437 RepID=A0A5M9GJI7_9SPHI|nr:DUF5712 family protein [Arcticibacter tournemirensis]KAA8474833.1 molybdopterin-guanine dinucleotide biosynthesis protein MobB [Arcticibacter tournemirensis]TQM49642.1 hypothetical protein BDE36_1367 [Arcticibacter tournemirensis]
MHINITDSEDGNNKGSSSQLVHYLEKENRNDAGKEMEHWFNQSRQDIQSYEVRIALDNNVAKLSKTDAKFFLINVSPSRKELAFLKEQFGEDQIKEKLKEYAVSVMDEYARNFKRPGIESNKDLLWFGKVEEHRYYSHKDPEVKQGLKKRGELKEGDQWHVQVIVSRKDISNRIKLSPMNKSRGSNQKHSQKIGQFDRTAFSASGERIFDEQFGFRRQLKDTLRYADIMKNGTVEQKIQVRNELLQTERKESSVNSSLKDMTPLTEPAEKSSLLESLLKTEQDYSVANFIRRKKRRKGDQGLRL